MNTEQIQALFDDATEWVMKDPGKARQLGEACEAAARALGAESSVQKFIPAAQYLQARAFAFDADFDNALRLIASARAGYIALGEHLEAMRTYVGEIFVWQELGRYPEAIQTGEKVLQQIAHLNGEANQESEIDALIARVYQNLGPCYTHTAQFDRALAAYDQAEGLFRKLNQTASLGEILNNRGIVLLYLGRPREALTVFQGILDIFDRADTTLRHAQVLLNIGNAHLLIGDFSAGLTAFERVRRILEPMAAQAEKQVLLLDLAEAYRSLNLFEEAATAYREVLASLAASGMMHDRARALWGLGTALIAQHQFDEAESILTMAAEVFWTAGNLSLYANVVLAQARLCAERGNHTQANHYAQHVLFLVSGSDWPLQKVQARLLLSDLQLPDPSRAQAHLTAAEPLIAKLNLPDVSYAYYQRLGHIHLLAGNLDDAETQLLLAVDVVDFMRAHLAEDRIRISFGTNKSAAYDDLFQLYISRNGEGDVMRAFDIAERAKARALAGLLGADPASHISVADPALMNKVHALQTELNSVYTQMMSGGIDVANNESASAPSDERTTLPALNERALALEREINRLHLQLNTLTLPTDQTHLSLANAISGQDLVHQLDDDSALLSYTISGDKVYAFIATPHGVNLVRDTSNLERDFIARSHEITKLMRQLLAQWMQFRAGMAFAYKHLARLEQATCWVLKALYDKLFKPVETYLQGVKRLIVIPHGVLHQLPFHALFDGTSYLIDRFIMSYAPSGVAWSVCKQREVTTAACLDKGTRGESLVVAVADELIPAVLDEARHVAARLGTSRLFLDAQATLETFRVQSSGCRMLHLACHGLFRPNNPSFSSLKLQDGWLLAADVARLNLTGAWVTLSTCESGRSHVAAGDEVIGLVRGFLAAGASSIIVSLWIVHDATTILLMDQHYANLGQGFGRAEALRRAQLAIKATHAHPYYWAPFITVGHG